MGGRFAQDVAEDTGYVPRALLAVPVSSPVRLLGVMTLLDRDADRPGAALFHEIADEAYFAGVTLVCAVNNVPAPTYPSQYASVISVAANDATNPFALDCNHAPPAEFGAPGIDLEIPWLGSGTIVATGNSFAAPHVAGLVARLLSKHPGLTPSEVKAVLRAASRNAVPGS